MIIILLLNAGFDILFFLKITTVISKKIYNSTLERKYILPQSRVHDNIKLGK